VTPLARKSNLSTSEWCESLHHYEDRSFGAYDVQPDGSLKPVYIQRLSSTCVRCGAPLNQGGRCPGRKS
jgi:hypothetical protein